MVKMRVPPTRYIRKVSNIIVLALHEGRPVPWNDVKVLKSVRGSESFILADFILAETVPKTITLPPRPVLLSATKVNDMVMDVRLLLSMDALSIINNSSRMRTVRTSNRQTTFQTASRAIPMRLQQQPLRKRLTHPLPIHLPAEPVQQ